MRRLAFMILLGLVVTLPAQAGLVKVEITGVVANNLVPPPAAFNRFVVHNGDSIVISFLVDSENFRDGLVTPTRGYVIDQASYTLTFGTATGPVVEALVTPYPGTPNFVLRNNDPHADGFFTATNSVVEPIVDLFLTERANVSPFYAQHFVATYDENKLSSLDILDAVGTYDFTGLLVFGLTVYDATADRPDMECNFQRMTISRVPVEVPVDLKPGGCPNPLNLKSHGVLPVAILGTPTLDVTKIDPASIRLNGVPPLRSSIEDVGTPFSPFTGKTDCEADCTAAGPDGFLDLSLKFDTQAVAATLGDPADGACAVLHLTGNFVQDFDRGGPIAGEDVARIQK